MYRNYVYVKIMATCGSKKISNVYLYVVATLLAYE